MQLLTVFVISFCLSNVCTQAKVEKPDIQVNFTNAGSVDRRVTIECSSKHHSYSSCTFYRNEEIINKPHTQTLEGHVQYIIPHVTEEHEGYYSCECYTNDADFTETSLRAPLILQENKHKPSIEFNMGVNALTCRSDGIAHSYILCILYKNNQQIRDSGKNHNKHGTHFEFAIDNIEGKQNAAFSCQCYETGLQWTSKSETWSPVQVETSTTIKGKYRTSSGDPETSTTIKGKYRTSSGDPDANMPIIIGVVVSVVIVLVVLAITALIYSSKQRKSKNEHGAGTPSTDYKDLKGNETEAVYATMNDEMTSTKNKDAEPDDATLTYASLAISAETKNAVSIHIHDGSVEYATVAKKPH